MKIAIASGKGGTGKTTLSTNLAAYISETISNDSNGQVVLVDLDVEEPNSGLFIKGYLINDQNKYRSTPLWDADKCTHCGECKTICNFNAIAQLPKAILIFPELCHSCFACSELCPEQALPMVNKRMGVLKHYQQAGSLPNNDKLTFIESRLDIGEISAVPLIKQTIEYVEDNFSDEIIKIFDSPPGTSCPVIETIKDADFVILVTEPTPFGLHDLKLAVETVKELGREFAIVINRYGIGDNGVEQYCLENNIQIIGKIPNMRQAASLYSQGELLYDKIPAIKEQLVLIYQAINRINR